MQEEGKDGLENTETTNEFDPSKFSGIVDTVEETQTTESTNETTTETTEETSTDDDLGFDWGSDMEDQEGAETTTDETTEETTEETQTTETTSESTEETTEESTEETTEETTDNGISDAQFEVFANELGIKAKTLPELKEAMLDLEKENERLRSGGPVTNKKIESLKDFLKLDTEELVKRDLEAQGFKGDKLNETIDTLKDNGLIEIEATKIRNAIDGAINKETNNITKSSKEAEAKQAADREESVKKLKGYIDSQEEMFGFKMAKDADSLAKVRDSHHKYITSGSFLTEITKSEQSLAESAWLWKNKDTLLKALKNNGLQQGRQEVLNDLGNPDVENSKRFSNPGGKGEFDPSKFKAGS